MAFQRRPHICPFAAIPLLSDRPSNTEQLRNGDETKAFSQLLEGVIERHQHRLAVMLRQREHATIDVVVQDHDGAGARLAYKPFTHPRRRPDQPVLGVGAKTHYIVTAAQRMPPARWGLVAIGRSE